MTHHALLNETHPTRQEVLEAGLGDYFGSPVRIVEMAGTPLWGDNEEIRFQRITVTLASGETLAVVFKRLLPDPDSVSHTYLREVLIYRRLLAGGRFGAPALYASVQDEARERYWLFIEDLGDQSLDHGDIEDWIAAARWRASLHAAYAGRENELRSLGCLGEHGPRFYRTLAAKARRNLAVAGAPKALARFEALMRGYESIIGSLVGGQRTLVHGDFAPHNVALQPGGRIRPLDWEWAAIGPGAWDLSRLLYDCWNAKPIEAYIEELRRNGAVGVDPQELADSTRRCNFVYKVWYLSQPEVCRDPARVEELLGEMEAAR